MVFGNQALTRSEETTTGDAYMQVAPIKMADTRINRAEEQGGEGEGDCQATTYRVYKRRFAIALTMIMLNFSNVGMSYNLVSVSYKAADYFEVTLSQINLFIEIHLLIPIVFSLASTFIYSKFDLKAGIHVGSALNCMGALIRAIATSGLIAAVSTQYVVSLIGQAVASMGSPFLLFIATKVAQNWFPDKERTMATSIMAFSISLATSVAQVLSPLLAPSTQDVPTINYVYGGVALLCELAVIVCVTRARPPTPPSRSAKQDTGKQAPYLQQLRETLTSLPFVGILLMFAISLGVMLGLTSTMQQMICSTGYSGLFCGMAATIYVLSGFTGSIVLALVVRRTKALTSMVKLTYAIGTLSAITFLEMFLVPNQHALLLVACSLLGFFWNGSIPLSLELAVEATYPAEQTLSSTFMYVTAEITAVIMINMITYLSGDLPHTLEGVEVCTEGLTSDLEARDYSVPITGLMILISITVIFFILLFRTTYKRRQAGQQTASSS